MNFSAVVFQQIDEWIGEIENMDIETVARETGFQKRSQLNIDIKDLALGVLAMVSTGRLSGERVASSVARRARKRYSKQALHKRIGSCAGNFLLAVFSRCMQPTMKEAVSHGLFSSFKRILLHDSTTIPLPKRYASHFPGSSNQRTAFSQLKIQVVCDLLIGRVEHLSLSGFTRNDQRASPDILTLLRPGDLIIRDLGYFVLSVFADIIAAKAFFRATAMTLSSSILSRTSLSLWRNDLESKASLMRKYYLAGMPKCLCALLPFLFPMPSPTSGADNCGRIGIKHSTQTKNTSICSAGTFSSPMSVPISGQPGNSPSSTACDGESRPCSKHGNHTWL